MPGSKTPLSALKHAKTAISPMLAELLCSPLISKDQMRGMQSMQALLASPPGAIKCGSTPNATPVAGRLTSDVVRCLDMSEAVTSSIGSISGSKIPGDSQIKPVVLDSIGRMGASSVMMRNALSADAEQIHNSAYGKLGVNGHAFVQMPVYNDAEAVAPGTADTGPPARQTLAQYTGTPGRFWQPLGSEKTGSKRRLSVDSVRMDLHALLDKA